MNVLSKALEFCFPRMLFRQIRSPHPVNSVYTQSVTIRDFELPVYLFSHMTICCYGMKTNGRRV